AAAGAANQAFVAAAGNDASDNDLFPSFPSSSPAAPVGGGAASDRRDQLAGFSNWGAPSVDLCAPGVEIVSTIPGGGYGITSGTVVAAPRVRGPPALLFGRFPGLTPVQAKRLLLDAVDPVPGLAGRTVTGGRLDLGAPPRDPDAGAPGAV